MTIEEFKKTETIRIKKPCWVNGKFHDGKKKDDFVDLSGNDKIELLASGKAEKVDASKKFTTATADAK